MDELDGLNKKDLKKLLGVVIMSDGHIDKRGSYRSLRLVTSTKGSEPLHTLFRKICVVLYNKCPSFKKLEWMWGGEKKPFLRSELCCLKAIDDMMQFSPSYKTSPHHKQDNVEYLQSPQPDISFLLNSSRKLRILALRIWFDFDGSLSQILSVKRKIVRIKDKRYEFYQVQLSFEWQIAETNPTLVKQLLILSKSLSLNPTIKKDKRIWSGIGGIRFGSRSDIIKFIKLGGPFTNVAITKNSKNLAGITKKTLCKNICKLLENGNSLSAHFKKRSDAEKYKENLKMGGLRHFYEALFSGQ